MKNKLVSLPSCLSVLLILCSCVQVTNDLDLDKDLLLDMRLAPDGIDIPVGTLDTIHVDSLLRVDYDDPDVDDSNPPIAMEFSFNENRFTFRNQKLEIISKEIFLHLLTS